MKEKKKFSETAVGKFLLGNGGKAILETVGDIIPGANVIKTLIQGDRLLSDENKKVADALLEAERAEFDGISRRWEADAASDNKLSKTVRPMILILCFTFMVLFTILDSYELADFHVSEPWITFWTATSITVFGAYFGSKGFERVADKKRL